MIRQPNPGIHVPKLRLQPQELRHQEFEIRSLVNLLPSITEKFQLRLIALGPGTPLPTGAEAIRMFKKQVSLMPISLKNHPFLASITYQQLLRQAGASRNTMVTHGGVTPRELAFGRRPADAKAIKGYMTPPQLATEVVLLRDRLIH